MLDVLIAPTDDLDAGDADMGPLDGDTPDAQPPDIPDLSLPIPGDVMLAAGRFHTCALAGGAIYCWGSNEQGCLGVGDTARREAPTRVGTASDWVQIRAALNSTCALDTRGQVSCWGDAQDGQLGTGQAMADALTPTRVALPHPALDLATGSAHVCAVLQTGELYCWGSPREGKLGPSYPLDVTALAVPAPVDDRTDWRAVATGEGHTCGLRAGGELVCWGRNARGTLALGEGTAVTSEITRVGAASDWVSVRASQNTTCAVRAGNLYCWGANESGQIDVAIAERDVREPTLLGPVADAHAFAVGPFGTCRVDSTGALLCRGRNREGQLGLSPQPIDSNDPDARAEIALDTPRTSTTTGGVHTCGVDAEGVAYAEKLKAAGVAVEHVGFPRMTHAFFQAPALLDDSREAVDRAGAALKNAFAG